MKYFIFLTFLLCVFYFLGFFGKTEKFLWLDRNYTTAIKGFSIITVVWAHSGAMLSVGGIQFIAGVGVALFLICSGYGLEISYEKNRLKGFWRKRLLSVCFPFWITEFIGLLLDGDFSIRRYILDMTFIKPATSYGWFMGYIIICYLIYYLVKCFITDRKIQTKILIGTFLIWFWLESVFFANPSMPFLRARQMLCFPCGILMAMKKDNIEKIIDKTKSIMIFVWGGTMCFLFMAITQLQIIKKLPYLLSNTMALFTCFPLALGILILGKNYSEILENKILVSVGMLSYEIYLVHAFTLNLIDASLISIFIFLIATYAIAYALHIGMEKMKNGRFNSSYIDEK